MRLTPIPLDPRVADRLGRAVPRALRDVQDARERIHAGDTATADAHLLAAQETLQTTHQTLRAEEIGDTPNRDDPFGLQRLPLSGLATLNTPTARDLLAAVDVARLLAYQVDEERGDVLDNGTPCGLADTLDDLYHRLSLEINGPKGRE